MPDDSLFMQATPTTIDLHPYLGAWNTTPTHDALREQVRQFAESEIRPRIDELEQPGTVHRKLSRMIAEQGWIGVTIERRYGGLALGHLAKTIIIEELARVCGAMGAMVQASQLGVAKIIHFGNETQKQRWLPEIAAGRCLPTIVVTEADAGSHVLGMTTSAYRDGDHYVLNGSKVFIGNSHVGDLHGVVARTGEGSGGLTAFLVEADRKGLHLAPQQPTLGLHGFSFGELVFDNCRIPVENRLGQEGDGLAVAHSSSILYGRPNLAPVSLGIHTAIVEDTVRFANQHRRYGDRLSALPTVIQQIGHMQSNLMTARTVLYNAVSMLDQGRPCDHDLINAKLVNYETSLDTLRRAMDVHAAHGLMADRPLTRYLRDAWHIGPPGGTSDVQRIRLAERALGTNTNPPFSVTHRDHLMRSAEMVNEPIEPRTG